MTVYFSHYSYAPPFYDLYGYDVVTYFVEQIYRCSANCIFSNNRSVAYLIRGGGGGRLLEGGCLSERGAYYSPVMIPLQVIKNKALETRGGWWGRGCLFNIIALGVRVFLGEGA